MADSFYFYDLETTGTSPRSDRVMQFAGQRTDKDLNPVGEPDNILIKITPDILPQPDAILVTGITPQQTLAEGITEAEFLKYFAAEISRPNTIIVGFNNIRFDDEFMRFMLWRNYYDAYEWQWKDGSSRWDILDVARMTRALRPDGIKWPFTPDGKPTNRLEMLSDLNKLEHVNAHDALSDVTALIDVARLIKNKQPKLFDYLLNMRGKQNAGGLVGSGRPFVYSSGRYPSEFLHTTLAYKVSDHPKRAGALVYDLRVDPEEFIKMDAKQLADLWGQRGKDRPYFPVKTIMFNRCPAIAPESTLDAVSAERIKIDLASAKSNLKKLKSSQTFAENLRKAMDIMDKAAPMEMIVDPMRADEQLYDGFVGDADRTKMSVVRAAGKDAISDLAVDFEDERLTNLLPLYKARNFPKQLSQDETVAWEKYRQQKLAGGENSRLAQYFNRLNELAAREAISDAERYILEELNLYGQAIAPDL